MPHPPEWPLGPPHAFPCPSGSCPRITSMIRLLLASSPVAVNTLGAWIFPVCTHALYVSLSLTLGPGGARSTRAKWHLTHSWWPHGIIARSCPKGSWHTGQTSSSICSNPFATSSCFGSAMHKLCHQKD